MEANMGDKSPRPSEWSLHISGDANEPEADQIFLIRDRAGERIRLEIDVPGLRSETEDQIGIARQKIQAAVDALQAALNSPTALPVLRRM